MCVRFYYFLLTWDEAGFALTADEIASTNHANSVTSLYATNVAQVMSFFTSFVAENRRLFIFR